MSAKFSNFIEHLRSTYWIIPSVMALLSIVLSIGLVTLDLRLRKSTQVLGWVYTGGAEGARTLLSTVAGSMITVAGVVFSITIVALTLASQQFGPRLLRNFVRDTGNQVVLGMFISTFIYCLLVLRTVRGLEDDLFVPNISVTVGVLMTVLSLGVLIYFIHHTAVSIQAENIVARVGQELEEAIERLFPNKNELSGLKYELKSEEDIPADFDENLYPIRAKKSGYVQAIEYRQLINLAAKNDLILHTNYRAGEFIAEDGILVEVCPQERVKEELSRQLYDAFVIGAQRVQTQDVEYHVNRLVEIAVRALSPSINDPFTAMSCIDRLASGLALLAEKTTPPLYRYDDDGQLRLITDTVTFSGVVDAAFHMIRQYGVSSVAVTIRLLEAIAIIAAHTNRRQERAALLRHARMIKRDSDAVINEPEDLKDVEERYRMVLEILNEDLEGLRDGRSPQPSLERQVEEQRTSIQDQGG